MTSNSTEVSRAEPSGAGLTGLAPASDKSHASPQWWTGAVVYQIYPRSFQDSDGDGVGDLRGVLQRIDHLSGLGVDVVWFSPLYRSPHDDNGYDISDYQDVDPLFGDMRDLDDVIHALHARGIKVVMDLVVNHTSDEHPWFLESRSSQSNPKRDWYWWRPARHGVEPGSAGAEPTNWGSHFGGPAWEYDPATADYYLHLFSRKMPDLNWENPEVREAIYEMMRWWLDRGIDGFRMDVINLISKILTPDGSLADSAITTGPYGDHMAPTVNGPRIHEFLQEMHREVFDRYQSALLLVGETIGGTVEDAALFTDPARRELDMVFTFDHMSVDLIDGDRFVRRPLDLRDLKAALTNWQIGLAQVGWNSLYWENHDQPRIVSRFGDDGAYRRESATMLATILHLHRGTPYIYQGEELGMTNPGFTSLEEYRDIDSLNYAAQSRELDLMDDDRLLQALAFGSRDNARTPMQWDSSPQAGFTTGEPWIAVNPNHTHINAETERADPHSVFHHYRRLIALRHTEDTVRLGDFHLLLPQDPAVYAFTRTLDGDALLVVGNFTGDHQDIDLAEMSGTWAVLVLGNYPDAAAPMSTHLRLRPWEALVLRGVTQ